MCEGVSNPGAVHEKTYTYDNNDNLTSISAPSTPWQSRTYGYDAINRLTHAEGPYGTIDYTYDNAGNRLTKTESSSTTAYTYYPATNRLHEAVTGAETITHAFDPNGNMTGLGLKVLTYNQDNRLVKVEEGGTTLGEYIYNGLGQRVIKNAGGVTTVFLYDFDGNIIAESDQTGSISREYLYKGSSRLAMVDVLSGNMYYYGNDQLGTPQIMTDSTNTVVWEADYNPFGEADVNPNSSVVNQFRFPGQYYDSETGLHYNYHRYFDPSTGRYLTADPIGLDGMDPNIYGYVLNNPVNYIDKNGLKLCKINLPGLGDAYIDDKFYPLIKDFLKRNKESGADILFNYAFRSTEQQKSFINNPNAAMPGNSLHEAGFAVDIKWARIPEKQKENVIKHAKKAGLSSGAGFKEPWHFYKEVPGGRNNRPQYIKNAQEDFSKGVADCEPTCGNE